MKNDIKDTLETFMDQVGLAEILSLLSEVCQEKADHIRASYQDEPLAVKWEAKSTTLSDLSNDPRI